MMPRLLTKAPRGRNRAFMLNPREHGICIARMIIGW